MTTPLPSRLGNKCGVSEPRASASGHSEFMQQEGTHTDLEACLHAEARIREAGQWLLDVRPGSIDRCQSELQQVAAVLEGLAAQGTFHANPPLSSALLRIRRSAHALRFQIQYASNLYLGWIQLRLGAGYTKQGLPVLATNEPGCSFEG
jgi:hypothetical protein